MHVSNFTWHQNVWQRKRSCTLGLMRGGSFRPSCRLAPGSPGPLSFRPRLDLDYCFKAKYHPHASWHLADAAFTYRLDSFAASLHSLKISMPQLVQIMAWRRTGAKSLSEPMTLFLTDAYLRHSVSMSKPCLIPIDNSGVDNTKPWLCNSLLNGTTPPLNRNYFNFGDYLFTRRCIPSGIVIPVFLPH